MLPTMLLVLLEAGFSLYHIPWGITFINPREPLGYAAPLPAMETITRKHVEYDLWSAEMMRWVSAGLLPFLPLNRCLVPPDAVSVVRAWVGWYQHHCCTNQAG
jgi:hypothetical protein